MAINDSTTTPQDSQAGRTVDLHIALIEALVDKQRAQHCPLDLRVMGVIYELSKADRAAIADFVAKCQEARAAYSMTAQDVATRLKISVRSVQRLTQSGALNGTRIGGRWWFTNKQLERFTLAHAYVNGGRIRPDSPWVSRIDARLAEQARAQLGDGDWTVKMLADVFYSSRDEAYRLVLGWHAAYLINYTERRGWYRFAEGVGP